jgi:hypothetical protein
MNAWKWAGLAALALASGLIFTWYLRPDMVVSAGNAFLALCGIR